MKKRKSTGHTDVAVVYDGNHWRIVSPEGELACAASSVSRLPGELVSKMREVGVRSARFLLSGDVHKLDKAIPASTGFVKACDAIRASLAEILGEEALEALVAGRLIRWTKRKSFTLSGHVDGNIAGDLAAQLEDEDIVCRGFASLELAFLEAWSERNTREETLVLIAGADTFVIPPRRGSNQGPYTVRCGSRHFTSDSENFMTRLKRALAEVDPAKNLHLAVLDDACVPGIAAMLHDAGYANVVVKSGELFSRAVALAQKAKPNRMKGVGVPVVDPYEPRKKFSNGWLVLAAALLLALPVGYRMLCERQTREELAAISAESAAFRPLEMRVKSAQKTLADAEKVFNTAALSSRSRIEARRPLKAFIDVAYFFCRHAGSTVVLDSITQSGDRIEVSGTFTDPEDGVKLGSGLLAYSKEKNLSLVTNESVRDTEDENGFRYRFSITLAVLKNGSEAR